MFEFRKYENKEGIMETNFQKEVTCYCPLGGNFRTMNVVCNMKLGDYYCDMLDLEEYLAKDLNGKEMTAEQLADDVFATLVVNYEPRHLRVEVKSHTHLPIDVIKEY